MVILKWYERKMWCIFLQQDYCRQNPVESRNHLKKRGKRRKAIGVGRLKIKIMASKKWKCTICGTTTYHPEYPNPGRCPRNGNGPHSWIQVGRKIMKWISGLFD